VEVSGTGSVESITGIGKTGTSAPGVATVSGVTATATATVALLGGASRRPQATGSTSNAPDMTRRARPVEMEFTASPHPRTLKALARSS